jgi:hypothetical protein
MTPPMMGPLLELVPPELCGAAEAVEPPRSVPAAAAAEMAIQAHIHVPRAQA